MRVRVIVAHVIGTPLTYLCIFSVLLISCAVAGSIGCIVLRCCEIRKYPLVLYIFLCICGIPHFAACSLVVVLGLYMWWYFSCLFVACLFIIQFQRNVYLLFLFLHTWWLSNDTETCSVINVINWYELLISLNISRFIIQNNQNVEWRY